MSCFLGFVLLLVTIISFSSGGKKSTTLTGEGALLVNLDGYLTNRDETLRWQDALSELNGEHVPKKLRRMMWYLLFNKRKMILKLKD